MNITINQSYHLMKMIPSKYFSLSSLLMLVIFKNALPLNKLVLWHVVIFLSVHVSICTVAGEAVHW